MLTGCCRVVKPVQKPVPITKPTSVSTKVPSKVTPSKATSQEIKSALTGKPIPQYLPPAGTKFVAPSGKAAAIFKMLHFAFNRYSLTSQDQKILPGIGKYLLNNPDAIVLIQGYCDERGTQQYNLILGEQRALSARTFLIGLGISPKRLFTISYGKEDPLNPAHNQIAWAENRRVEFKIAK